MLQPEPTLGERLRDSLRFWAFVLAVGAVVGLGAYAGGRAYFSRHLEEFKPTDTAPEIKPVEDEPGSLPAEEETVPEQPVITMRERQPTARERREAEQELQNAEPQDGASLHAREQQQADQPPTTPDATPPAPAPPTGGTFVVSAGSFASESNAQQQVTRLARMGYHPYVSRTQREGVTFTRVNVGQFPSRAEAERVADELRAKGFDAAVYAQ